MKDRPFSLEVVKGTEAPGAMSGPEVLDDMAQALPHSRILQI